MLSNTYAAIPKYLTSNNAETAARLALAFITSIIKKELLGACTESGISANSLIDDLNQINMYISGNEKYCVGHTENERVIKLMKTFGVAPGDLDAMAATESKRLGSALLDPYQRYPQPAEGTEPPRRVGRPKGSGKTK
jgi:hypothetical protein